MFRAIIFDFFDVIRTDDYKSWLTLHGYENEGEFLEANKKLDHGLIDVPEFLEELSRITGQDVASIDREMEEAAGLDHDVIALIEDLQKKYKIGLLSNAPSGFIRGLFKEHDLEKYFDAIVVSSEVGMLKPAPEMFHHILSKLEVKPGEAVFIDDNPSNVAGAENVGIEGIVYTDVNKLKDDLRELDI